MVSTIKRWLGIDVLEEENLRLVKSALATKERFELHMGHIEDTRARVGRENVTTQDHEARIAFLENSLTAKPTTAKIVPKTANWKQFRTAAEKASESEQENA